MKAHQASLSMGFSRQEYWSGLQTLLQEIFPTQGSNPQSLTSLALAGSSLPLEPPRKSHLTSMGVLFSQSCLILCSPMDCSLPDSSVHWDSPGKNTGVGGHSLLHRISPTQGSNPGLPHCRKVLYCLNHQVWVPISKHRWHHREKYLFANRGITQWLQTLH